MEYTSEQLDTMFENLPDDIQEVLYSVETIQFLTGIEKKYNLQREQTKELSAEIGMLMLGASSPQQFIPSIEKSMKISNEIAKAIASETNEKVFSTVKESLKKLYFPGTKAVEKELKEITPVPLPTRNDEKNEKTEVVEKEIAQAEAIKKPDLYRESVLTETVPLATEEKLEEKKPQTGGEKPTQTITLPQNKDVPEAIVSKKDFLFSIPKKVPESQKEEVKEPEKPADPYRETV